MTEIEKQYDIVVFHYPCYDGLVSAWVATTYHKNLGLNLELYPIQHGDTFDYTRVTNKRVLFCDFSPSLDTLNYIEMVVQSIHILDHHKTAEEALIGKKYAEFDMDRSGARMTWDYFYKSEPPMFVQYIEDRDLWRWKFDNTKPFILGFFDLCKEYYNEKNFTELFNKCNSTEKNMDHYISYGIKLANRENEMIKEKLDSTMIKGSYNNMNCRIIECGRELASEVGSRVSETFDFAVLWNKTVSHDNYTISLRSNSNNPHCADVAVIAQQFGGGGHKHAAGFISQTHPNDIFRN